MAESILRRDILEWARLAVVSITNIIRHASRTLCPGSPIPRLKALNIMKRSLLASRAAFGPLLSSA